MNVSITQVMIIVALIAVTIVLTMGATPRQRRPETRPLAGAGISPTNAIIGGGALILGLCWMTVLNPYLDYRRVVSIREHGQPVQAQVTSIYRSCHKSCSLHVRYEYSPTSPRAGGRLGGDGYLGSLQPGDPHVLFAQQNGFVPVAYDATEPDRSELNFDGEAFTTDREQRILSVVEVGGGITLFVAVFALALLRTGGRRRTAQMV